MVQQVITFLREEDGQRWELEIDEDGVPWWYSLNRQGVRFPALGYEQIRFRDPFAMKTASYEEVMAAMRSNGIRPENDESRAAMKLWLL